MKKKRTPYDAALLEIIDFERVDIVTASGGTDTDADADEIRDNVSPDTWL